MMTEHIFRTSTIAIKFCIQTRDKLQNFFTATILLPKLHLLPQSKNHPKKVLLNTGFVVSFLILGKIQKYCLNKKFELPFLGQKSCSFCALEVHTMWSVNDGAAGSCCGRFSAIYRHKSPNQWHFPPKTDLTQDWKYR